MSRYNKKSKKIKTEQPKVNTIIEDEGTQTTVNVIRTTLNFSQAQDLKAGDMVKHIRVAKVLSITHYADKTAKVELEIIKI